MVRVAEVAEARGEIHRADEDAVDAVHRGDLGHRGERLAALYLHYHAGVVVRLLQVVLDGAAAIPALRDRDAADALRRAGR